MFRALLWKEWRELWVMPAVAALLAAMSFFVTKAAFRQPTAFVWDASFSAWLFIAAIYIPTHLYTREREARTIDFLFSRPTNRYYLWWVWLFVGIITLAAVGALLCGVTDALSRLFFFGDVSFAAYRSKIIAASVGAALVIFSLSTLSSAIFKRQLSAIAATLLAIILVYVLWRARLAWSSEISSIIFFYPWGGFKLFGKYVYQNNSSYSSVIPFIICPGLLFLSLALFAKGSAWRSSRKTIAQAYGLSGFVALVPMALGFTYLLSKGEEPIDIGRRTISHFRVDDVSRDGTQVWLATSVKTIVLDLPAREIRNPVYGRQYKYRSPIGGQELLTFDTHQGTKSQTSPREMNPGDYLQMWKEKLSKSKREYIDHIIRRRKYFDFRTSWSIDEKYVALFSRPSEEMREDGFLALMDHEGNLLGEQVFPLLAGESIYSIGWDYDSRFYYYGVTKEHNPHTTIWRISPDSMAPEEVPNLSLDGSSFCHMSPDGRWILQLRSYKNPREWGYWMYDISGDRLQFVAQYIRPHLWSPDGKTLAFATTLGSPRGLYKLGIYKPETGKTHMITPQTLRKLRLWSWSPSGKHLLLSFQTEETANSGGEEAIPPSERPKLYVLSTETIQMSKIEKPDSQRVSDRLRGYRKLVHWVHGDKLIWEIDRNKLIATEYDGSNPEELFRVEDGKYYLYGEEVG
jgi:hypothetical protein